LKEVTKAEPFLTLPAARLFASSHPASVQWGVPVDLAVEGAVVCNSVIYLWTITGNIDVPGGMARGGMNESSGDKGL